MSSPGHANLEHASTGKPSRMNFSHEAILPVEIPGLARNMEIDGIRVGLRCFWIAHPTPRYEIRVWGCGQTGVVDVAAEHESILGEQMEEVAICFATAIKIRTEFSS